MNANNYLMFSFQNHCKVSELQELCWIECINNVQISKTLVDKQLNCAKISKNVKCLIRTEKNIVLKFRDEPITFQKGCG